MYSCIEQELSASQEKHSTFKSTSRSRRFPNTSTGSVTVGLPHLPYEIGFSFHWGEIKDISLGCAAYAETLHSMFCKHQLAFIIRREVFLEG